MRAGPVVLYVIGVLLLSIMNIIMKHTIAAWPVVTANAWRYLFAAAFAAIIWQLGGAPQIRRSALPLHLVRGTLVAASAVAFFWALTRLTLVETITLTFIAPLLVPPLGALLLREPLDRGSVATGLLGFTGVVIASGVGTGDLTAARAEGMASALAGALAYALATILMRARAPQDGARVTGLLGALVPALVLVPAAVIAAPGGLILPGQIDFLLFVAAGLCGAAAIALFARALETADAQTLAPFEFTSLAWLALFGWVFFGEAVGGAGMVGAGLVVIAGIRQARRNRAQLPTV